MSDDDLAAIAARWAAATPGPWEVERVRNSGVCIKAGQHPDFQAHPRRVASWLFWDDAQAIAAAPTDIAALLAEVARSRAEQTWIVVEDRLPPMEEWVQVWTGEYHWVALLHPDWGWVPTYESEYWHSPTHWRPLPGPPVGSEQADPPHYPGSGQAGC